MYKKTDAVGGQLYWIKWLIVYDKKMPDLRFKHY